MSEASTFAIKEDLQGWNSDHPIFRQLIEQTQPEVIIEVGTWKGASAIRMAKICKELGLTTKIYCVDTWLGSIEFITTMKDTPERNLMYRDGYPQVFYQFWHNVQVNRVDDIITPIPNTSSNGARYFRHYGIKADLVYIDASHEYEDVKQDIINYTPLCNKVMFGDDWNHFADVQRAVNELLKTVQIVDENYWICHL